MNAVMCSRRFDHLRALIVRRKKQRGGVCCQRAFLALLHEYLRSRDGRNSYLHVQVTRTNVHVRTCTLVLGCVRAEDFQGGSWSEGVFRSDWVVCMRKQYRPVRRGWSEFSTRKRARARARWWLGDFDA